MAEDPGQTVVVFRSGRSLADSFLTVSVGQGELRGDPVDLDGDGVSDGGIGGNETGLGIIWRQPDGSIATIGATAELEQAALRLRPRGLLAHARSRQPPDSRRAA